MNLRTVDLRKLNSATKYPSILTYHVLGDRGRLKDEVGVPFPTSSQAELVVTEKLDGTSSRIVALSDGSYLIGSREELLHARGDVVANPALGIVDAIREVANRVADALTGQGRVVTFYGEVYGGKTTGSKAYGTNVGFRLFDVVHDTEDALGARLAQSAEEIARWRDGGGQQFASEAELAEYARVAGVELTPRIRGGALPTGLADVHAWMKALLPGDTLAPLGGDHKGRPEGVVVRTPDRKTIAKLRFEDYERTLR